MTSLPRFSVNNPVLVNLFMLTILFGGLYSALTIVREMFPESRPERVRILTLYPGATPAEIEKGITLKIEEQVKDVYGVEKVVSSITEGRSVIMLELYNDYEDVDQAVNDVKAAIDTIPPDDFPEEALETQVAKFEPRFPVISVAMYGSVDDRMLKTFGERLRNDLLTLPNVTDVTLSGTRKDEISVEVRPDRLAKYDLSFMQVAEAIAASNLDLPGGQVRTPTVNVSVRTLGEEDRGTDLYDIVVRSDPFGRVVRLSDVATIIDGFEDVEVSGRFNGAPSVNLTVYKTADQDAIEIASMVKALVAGKMSRPLDRPWLDRVMARMSGEDVVQGIYDGARSHPFPRALRLETHTDLSRLIESRLDLLMRNGRWGLVLVFLSLLVFLHWRVALWVMMGLVLAIAGSLICMRGLGQTLNLISMGGFIIVLGLLVDDAIIVSEHVFTKVEEGLDPKLAAIRGGEEVTWPVVCAITTTIVAFVPLRFIEGQIGDWMGVLPVVVCIALTISLLEALTILPSHLAHSLRPHTVRAPQADEGGARLNHLRGRLRGGQRRLLDALLERYERVLRLALRYRYVTITALVACLVAAGSAVATGHVPMVFLQKMDSETIIARVTMGVGAPVGTTQEAARVVERAALDLPETSSVYTLVGIQVSDEGVAQAPQSHLAQLFIELAPLEERDRSSDELTRELRARTAHIPGLEKLAYTAVHGGPGGKSIQLEIRGDRLDDLVAVAHALEAELAGFQGVYDIVNDFDAGRPEVQIKLNDSARAVGLTTQSLATQVRSAFYGFEARKVQRGREDVKIMVRYPQAYRQQVYDIESMRIATPSGALVPFQEVARLTEGTGFASINRTNQKRTVTVTADVDENVTNADQITGELAGMFPVLQEQYPGVQFAFAGERLEMQKSFGSLKHMFVIALLLVFVILAGLFKSYIQPLVVMTVIPFGLIGAVVGHWLMDYPLTIASMIGLVALTGVVVNDSMILVSFINRRVAGGATMKDAVVAGGRSRLRPILLTSATTVLGMGPLLLETSFQAKFLIPMGISISAGLIFATVLTLLAVPCLYLIVMDLRERFGRFMNWLFGWRLPDPVPASSLY